jgi:hypothetical protein
MHKYFRCSHFLSVPIFCNFLLIGFLTLGCSVENLNSNQADSNQSSGLNVNQLQPLEKLGNGIAIDSSHLKVLESILQKNLRNNVPEITKSITFDYERLEHSFLKMLVNHKGADQMKKYQFICDENERWIYRCNMESGEIECFSMSSNKLRLLSSVK